MLSDLGALDQELEGRVGDLRFHQTPDFNEMLAMRVVTGHADWHLLIRSLAVFVVGRDVVGSKLLLLLKHVIPHCLDDLGGLRLQVAENRLPDIGCRDEEVRLAGVVREEVEDQEGELTEVLLGGLEDVGVLGSCQFEQHMI